MITRKMIILGTPVAIAKCDRREVIDRFLYEYPDAEFEFQPDTNIYLNVHSGWTIEECDNILYCIDEETFKVDTKYSYLI